MAFEKEMQVLVDAEKARKPIGPVSDLVPGGLSLDDAHRICERNIEKRIQAGEKLAGYKIGFTNLAVREKMGLPDSTYGYLMDTMLLKSGVKVAMSDLIAPKIECEICFKLKAPLKGKGFSTEQVVQATEGVTASFEICDARIKDWKCPYNDFFADNGFSARVVLSGGWKSADELDFLNEKVILTQDGKDLAQGTGALAMGHPANAVAWLAGKLADRGKGLEAGQIVMTGTLTPILPIEKGSTYVAKFSTLGEVTATFV
ncbi:MAG: fumarylacetoacetate hydrolase family protein [Deltaproteobacteria bacterium]|nr:fumarylacetoacetate hydrolase family protein [Deltaproteobacteria bacterium]